MGNVNPMPFGYKADGTVDEQESAVIRFVFEKENEYYFSIPQELIEEAHAWAKSEGITLNDEEAADMARARLCDFIARQVREKFPDVKYRQATPPVGKYPADRKYPSKSFSHEDIIDRDLYLQVQKIIARS